jgi:hypothetical protein
MTGQAACRIQVEDKPQLIGRQDHGPKRNSLALGKLLLRPHPRPIGRRIERAAMRPCIVHNKADCTGPFQQWRRRGFGNADFPATLDGKVTVGGVFGRHSSVRALGHACTQHQERKESRP